jgi:hypothetical protein
VVVNSRYEYRKWIHDIYETIKKKPDVSIEILTVVATTKLIQLRNNRNIRFVKADWDNIAPALQNIYKYIRPISLYKFVYPYESIRDERVYVFSETKLTDEEVEAMSEVYLLGANDEQPKYQYPENILKIFREMHDLEEGDTSIDNEIYDLSPNELFDAILRYEGIIGYDYTIKCWIRDIYQIEIQ